VLGIARQLKAAGVLGINKRNADYILMHNKRSLYPLVDDKALTKKIAMEKDIAVPELYGTIEIQAQVAGYTDITAGREDFVVKPAQGSQGKGILVVTGRTRDLYRLADGSLLDSEAMAFHISNILSGIYSLGGQPDKALIEYRIKFDPVFEKISYQGVPDIRIIVYFGIPVMAMVRLPTRMSRGKANLHQGCIGAGIDIATGRTLTAVLRNGIVTEHPDTGNPVSGVEIPNWGLLLTIAAHSYELTGLAYQGIDLVLDRDLGPLILELNARPGLNIQIANRAGLAHRLEAVDAFRKEGMPLESRVAFARETFKSKIAIA